MSHPCVRVAAMVVSEIIERLSPNIAPQTTAPRQSGAPIPVASAMPTAMGAMAVMVPTDVPIAVEAKEAITKSPATVAHAGNTERPKLTVLVTHPAASAAPAKAPANRKTRHITITSVWPIARATTFRESPPPETTPTEWPPEGGRTISAASGKWSLSSLK